MIVGLGIDSVEVERFSQWHTLSEKQLNRIFHPTEITYCLSTPRLSAQRFAVRFAAREAFFKALSHYNPQHGIPFLRLCRLLWIEKKHGIPQMVLHPILLKQLDLNHISSLVSLTHTTKIATACVILSHQ